MIKKILIFILAIFCMAVLNAETADNLDSTGYKYDLEASDSLNKIDPILTIFGYDHRKLLKDEKKELDSVSQIFEMDSIYESKFNEIKKNRDALSSYWTKLTFGCIGSTLSYAIILGLAMWMSSINN
ncbi:MAG: hypothetical protein AB7T10_05930 [bacterium]